MIFCMLLIPVILTGDQVTHASLSSPLLPDGAAHIDSHVKFNGVLMVV